MSDKLLTCRTAGDFLGFSADYIRRLCLTSKIKAEKIGNTWMMSKAALKNVKRQRTPRSIKE